MKSFKEHRPQKNIKFSGKDHLLKLNVTTSSHTAELDEAFELHIHGVGIIVGVGKSK